MRLRKLGVVLCVVCGPALSLVASAAHAQESLRVEWFGVRATAGTLLPGATITAPTLLFDSVHLYWTTREGGFAANLAGAPYRHHAKDDDSVDLAAICGTAVGGQFRLGAEQRHELRLGAFLGGLNGIGGFDNGEGGVLTAAVGLPWARSWFTSTMSTRIWPSKPDSNPPFSSPG